jgi:hypothetical protein
MPIKIESLSGSITLISEDGVDNVDVTIPRSGIESADSSIVKLDVSGKLPAVDGSQLTNLPIPETPSGNVITAIASGTLSNGSTIILNSDGTVSSVGLVSTSIPENIPNGVASDPFNPDWSGYVSSSFDPTTTGRFVVTWRGAPDNGGHAVVGTVTGTNISFGTPSTYTPAAVSAADQSITFDPTSGKFVICYKVIGDPYNYGSGVAVVGTISGTDISFGADVVYNSGNTYYNKASFDPNATGKFVVAYKDTANLDKGAAIVGTVSGTSITFGSEYVFDDGTVSSDISISFDPNDTGRFVIAYTDASLSGYGVARVGDRSGTSLSFGAEYVFLSSASDDVLIAFDPNNAGKFVISYEDVGAADIYSAAVIGTIPGTGTTISFGTPSIFKTASVSGEAWHQNLAFSPHSDEFVIAYRDADTASTGIVLVGTVSGTSITYGSDIIFNPLGSQYNSIAFDSNDAGQFVISYYNSGNTVGESISGRLSSTSYETSLTESNYIGMSDSAYADAETSTIQVVGTTNDAQSGLTPGGKYYVQDDGTLSIIPGVPVVYAGISLSATKLLIKG